MVEEELSQPLAESTTNCHLDLLVNCCKAKKIPLSHESNKNIINVNNQNEEENWTKPSKKERIGRRELTANLSKHQDRCPGDQILQLDKYPDGETSQRQEFGETNLKF